MKLLSVFITLILLPVSAIQAGGFDLKTAMQLVETKNLPLDCNSDFVANHSIENPNNIIPDKIYENFQLTDFYQVKDFPNSDLGFDLCFKSHLGYNIYLGLVMVSGVSDPFSYVLISIDGNSKIVDTLEAGVYFGNIPIKQFRITDGKEVYVYQLIPTTTKSIPLNTFRSVNAYLKCTIYRIDSVGKFIKISETRSENTRTLTRDELNDDSKNLWDWYQLKLPSTAVNSVRQ